MSARILASTIRRILLPAAPRPPDDRDPAGRAVPPARLVGGALRRHTGDLRPGRRHHARDLPDPDDVPDHQHRDAARTPVRHAGTAVHDPARQARPAVRLRHRVRHPRRAAGRHRLRGRILAARSRHGRQHRPGDPDRGGQRRARRGARAVLQRVRPHGVPGRAVHAGRRPAADPAVRAVRSARGDGRLAAGDQRRAAADLRRGGPAGGGRPRRSDRRRCGATSPSSAGRPWSPWCSPPRPCGVVPPDTTED